MQNFKFRSLFLKGCAVTAAFLGLTNGSEAFAEKVQLRINEWPTYVSMHKKEFEAFAKKKGLDVELIVVKPDISDEQVLFENLRKEEIDVITPTESFIHARQGKLMNLIAPIDESKVEGYEVIPESLRKSKFHHDDKGKSYGVVFMAGLYGLYYNSEKVKTPPTSWDVLWSDAAKGKYSVSADTYFVNGHISQWTLDGQNIENAYDVDKMNKAKLQSKLDHLAKEAAHLWKGVGNTPDQLKNLNYTASWGFELPSNWRLAHPKPGSPMWVDVLSISKKAAANPKKLQAYYLLASFTNTKEAQHLFMQRLRAFPLNAQAKSLMKPDEIATYRPGDNSLFDARFFWRPLTDRTGNTLMEMWKAAVSKRGSAI
ncbi:ABC transporter substrate-binding protein [Oligoflexus tunisiensis]|uniref:ABC transporter substrate-binding protein n=1 Tax=Oligoflexus tunisiensis TaxID=708132 RepID=UPI00114D31B9|nr:PotD/PotF family extracellular solute-binding protein [Oligoflexus tunisiensis]